LVFSSQLLIECCWSKIVVKSKQFNFKSETKQSNKKWISKCCWQSSCFSPLLLWSVGKKALSQTISIAYQLKELIKQQIFCVSASHFWGFSIPAHATVHSWRSWNVHHRERISTLTPYTIDRYTINSRKEIKSVEIPWNYFFISSWKINTWYKINLFNFIRDESIEHQFIYF
jgi:hypothetical protein